MLNYSLFWNLVFLMLWCSYTFCQDNIKYKHTLQSVVTVFRHGERTSDLVEFYPKDPYKDEDFFPYGNGQLNNKGKRNMFKLGKLYRYLYGEFLGSLYLPGLIVPYSTNYDRTQTSLQAFLAGLFPPGRTILEWNDDLDWNPIPYTVIKHEDQGIISLSIVYCPRYQKLYNEYRETPEGKAIEEPFKPFYPYISKHSGINITSPFDLFLFYFGLNTKKENGLKLPKWTERIYPEYMTDLIANNHILFTGTPELRQLFGGKHLKKTINDFDLVIKGNPGQPKMVIYSAHEGSIAALMGSLNIFYPHIPLYGASLILELHKIKQDHYVKIKYDEKGDYDFVDMQIPGCETLCPFNDFVNLLQENIPDDDITCAINPDEVQP